MEDDLQLKVIARMRSEFASKFGVPRQAGLVEELTATVVFEPEYRNPDALRGIEGFSHLWLVWGFHKAQRQGGAGNAASAWSPTVRPPRLGGNTRLGVFATRSPFRPNPVALSCVKLEKVELTGPQGPTLLVSGADLMDATPIYDIKPYVPYADCRPQATEGFASAPQPTLKVEFPEELRERLSPQRARVLEGVLAWDPRPHYHEDPQRVYGMGFAGYEVTFRVEEDILTVLEIQEKK